MTAILATAVPRRAVARGGAEAATRPSDGLVTFAVMWGFAAILSLASKFDNVVGTYGLAVAAFTWINLAAAVAVIVRPRQTWRLGLLALLMAAHYALRMPVASNNQTISFVMNASILVVVGMALAQGANGSKLREIAYDRLRVVARALLAVMYFYGIFHKINTDFLDPQVSCAVALYVPLTQLFGVEDSLFGRYGAIAATFVVEAITIIALYWKRFFAIGLILGLVFHYVIPISGFSWYMDFSSLVFALYMLSVPRDVSGALHATTSRFLRRLPTSSAGIAALVALVALLVIGTAVVAALALGFPARPGRLLWHSVWLIVWAVVGGVSMVFVTRAALAMLPYDPTPGPAQPGWLYLFPAALFVTSLSPYVGLKTESSIAMFSNLHTEGGVSNHLLFARPPYLFDYQSKLARVVDSSEPRLRDAAARGHALVQLELVRWLEKNPRHWVSYELEGRRFERVTQENYAGWRPNPVEQALLIFKPVDFARPKVCTH